MKKYIDPIPDGGAPLHNNRITTQFQNDIWAALEAALAVYQPGTGNYGIIVDGCVVTDNAGNFDISEGVVYLNGRFLRLPASTNQTFPKYIEEAAETFEAKQFADGDTKDLISVRVAQLVSGVPSDQYVAITALDDDKIRNIRSMSPGAIHITFPGVVSYTKLRKVVLEIGDWNMYNVTGTGSKEIDLVPYGIDPEKVRSVFISIRSDAGTVFRDLYISGHIVAWLSTGIEISREAAGTFDSTSYDSTSFNRGWITIEYEES